MLCELGNPFKRNQRVRAGPGQGSPSWGLSRTGPAHSCPPPVQAELTITFEAIGIMLDTRELELWLDLST